MEFVRKQPKMEEVDCGSQLHLTNSVLNVIQWIDDCVAELIYWYASQLTKMIYKCRTITISNRSVEEVLQCLQLRLTYSK